MQMTFFIQDLPFVVSLQQPPMVRSIHKGNFSNCWHKQYELSLWFRLTRLQSQLHICSCTVWWHSLLSAIFFFFWVRELLQDVCFCRKPQPFFRLHQHQKNNYRHDLPYTTILRNTLIKQSYLKIAGDLLLDSIEKNFTKKKHETSNNP